MRARPSPVKNTLGFTAIRPAGLKAYPAIWVQDFTMGYSSGFVSIDEGLAHFTDGIAPDVGRAELAERGGDSLHAIPDHINFDGSAGLSPGNLYVRARPGRRTMGNLPAVEQLLRLHLAGPPALEGHRRCRLVPAADCWTHLAGAVSGGLCALQADAETGIVFTTVERRRGLICNQTYIPANF